MASKTTKLLDDINSSKHVTIIGISILGTDEFSDFFEEHFFSKLEKNQKKCLIIAESDNQLFQLSLIRDVQGDDRKSFEQLKINRKFFFSKLNKSGDRSKNSTMRISSLMLPFYAVITDKNLWHLPINVYNADEYVVLSKNTLLYNAVDGYIKFLNDEKGGGKFLANPKAEMLELFDQNKVPRGIFPRDSFYNTDHYQYVVWGLVFNREGKLLIHKRKENAKDNQNMWDKSVGGHIDFENEKSTQEAVVRELIEELYKEEKVQQTGHGFSMLSEDISKVYFLGDWRLEDNGPYYLDHIKLIESKKKSGEENWVFYKLPYNFTHNTPRILPDNRGERWLRVMVDVFVFITNTEVNDEYLLRFKNSQYLLIDPNRLKTWMEEGLDERGNEFLITPDLKYIMTGKLRNVIDEVSSTIKFSNIRK